MLEHWKDIEGFEGTYQISDLGRVKSLPRTYFSGKNNSSAKHLPETILKPATGRKGYLFVGVRKNGKSYDRYIHRLVAQAFVPNPENKPEVNHKWGNKKDNRAIALEWNTHKENQKHASDTKLMAIGERHGATNLTWKDVIFIRTHSHLPKKLLAEKYGCSRPTISRIINRKVWNKV